MTSYCPDVPAKIFFPARALKFISDFNFPEHGRFQTYKLAETTTAVFNLKTAVSNKFDINRCSVQEDSNRREAVDHVSNVTGVETSMAINLGRNAEADTLHYD